MVPIGVLGASTALSRFFLQDPHRDFVKKTSFFLIYLYHSGKTITDLSKAIPSRAEIKLPVIYKKEELLQMIKSIDRGSISGKRDYAIILMLTTYGIRATDLINLKVANMDFNETIFLSCSPRLETNIFISFGRPPTLW